jgi:hypothetical protein
MNANYFSAIRASILLLLVFEKRIYTFSFKFFNILHHAHVIVFAVSFVQMRKVFARHRIALAARLNFVFSKFGAPPYYIAVFASGNAASTMSYFTPLARNIISVS